MKPWSPGGIRSSRSAPQELVWSDLRALLGHSPHECCFRSQPPLQLPADAGKAVLGRPSACAPTPLPSLPHERGEMEVRADCGVCRPRKTAGHAWASWIKAWDTITKSRAVTRRAGEWSRQRSRRSVCWGRQCVSTERHSRSTRKLTRLNTDPK